MSDRPKRSWSEIDKLRDGRSGGSSAKKGTGAGRKEKGLNKWQQKQADKRFDSLFTDPKRDEAVAKIRSRIDKEGFTEAVDAYLAEYGFPQEYDLWQVILEAHPDEETRVEALRLMDEGVDEQADSTQQVFKSRVKLLKLTAREPKLKKLAGKIAKRRNY